MFTNIPKPTEDIGQVWKEPLLGIIRIMNARQVLLGTIQKRKLEFRFNLTLGENRTFIKGICAQDKPSDPIPFSKDPNSDFYKQAMEVYEISRDLNFEKHLIAEYWKDDGG